MNRIVLAMALIAGIFTQTVFAQDRANDPLFSAYFGLKNALVNSDAKAASLQSGELLKQLKTAELSERKEQLVSTAARIADSKDIEKQREAFAGLSLDFFKLARNMKRANPLYYQYCPMKKAYWLSASKDIKNPYYGKQMLTCGRVEDTLE